MKSHSTKIQINNLITCRLNSYLSFKIRWVFSFGVWLWSPRWKISLYLFSQKWFSKNKTFFFNILLASLLSAHDAFKATGPVYILRWCCWWLAGRWLVAYTVLRRPYYNSSEKCVSLSVLNCSMSHIQQNGMCATYVACSSLHRSQHIRTSIDYYYYHFLDASSFSSPPFFYECFSNLWISCLFHGLQAQPAHATILWIFWLK